MSDLDQLKALLDKAQAPYDVDQTPFDCGIVSKTTKPADFLRAWFGYQCHFEAEFDVQGNILNIGQWEDM